MNTPARTLRNTVENHHKRPEPTARELDLENRIVVRAQTAFAEHGRRNVTVDALALGLRIARSTLRRCFCDLDALLAEILHRHLTSLAKAFGEIPHDAPDIHQQRRAAYLALTRTALGGLNEAHLLLVRDRQHLPADLLLSVEAHRYAIGLLVAGPLADMALDMLDFPNWDAETIEIVLATLAPKPAEPAEPAQPAAAAAKPTPPAPPPTTEAREAATLAPWPHLALETRPGDPPDDLTRLGRGFSAPKLTLQDFADIPPKGHA